MTATRTIRVLVAEDQPMIRAAFASLLSAQPDIEVVGTVADGAAAVREAGRLHPAVTLMDIRMPVMDGIAATRGIRAARASNVLVLTTFREESLVLGAVEAGASGFLLKDSDPTVLLTAVHRIAAGKGFLDPAVTPTVLGHVTTTAAPATVPGFTARESEVLALVCEGMGNRDIADRLVVAESTVKTHVKALLGKTGSRDRVGLVVWAARRGLLGSDGPLRGTPPP